MNKLLLIVSVISCMLLAGCDRNNDADLEKVVKFCWNKYKDDEPKMLSDPKCSNFAVLGRLSEITHNRQCGYPDLYNGERNLNDLSNLSKKDREYVNKVISCADRYLKYAASSTRVPNAYDYSSKSMVLAELSKDNHCNIPAVAERLDMILMAKRHTLTGDEFCRK